MYLSSSLKKLSVFLRQWEAIIRQRGSHVQLRHVDGRRTTVPMHKGRDIAPGLLRKITSDIGLKIESFLQHR